MTFPKSRVFSPAPFIAIHCLVWWLTIILAKSQLDSYGDMSEVFGWSQHWLMGSDKHPQFLPWMTRLWFFAAPRSVESFYLLSAVNLAVGMYGILAFGRAVKLPELQIAVALALTALALPYLTLPAKLNMNAICLSVWPWVAWAFAKAADKTSVHRNIYAAALGLLSAIAMLSKYYSVVLLIPLLLLTLTTGMRWIWRTAVPFIAGAAFLAASAPHLVWLIENSDAVRYAADQGSGAGTIHSIRHIAEFFAVPLIYWPVPVLLAALLLVRGKALVRLRQMVDGRNGSAILLTAAIGPWATALVFAATGFVELSLPWAIPIGFAFTLYLVQNADAAALERNGPRIVRAYRFIWPAMIAAGLAVCMVNALKPGMRHYTPNAESARAIVENWRYKDTMPLRWVAEGDQAELVAFFAPAKLEALPALPDRLPDYYPPRTAWQKEAGVVMCSLTSARTVDENCMGDAAAWAQENGLNAEAVRLTVRRSGLRFPKEIDFNAGFVYVWPR